MPRTVLAVDDSPSLRQLVQVALSHAGYDVVTAADGRAALTVAEERDLDAVVTDLNMPGMDGLELTRRLRQHARHRHVPIIVLTTESDATRKADGKAAGATGWVVKPFTPDQLVGVVRRVAG